MFGLAAAVVAIQQTTGAQLASDDLADILGKLPWLQGRSQRAFGDDCAQRLHEAGAIRRGARLGGLSTQTNAGCNVLPRLIDLELDRIQRLQGFRCALSVNGCSFRYGGDLICCDFVCLGAGGDLIIE